MLEVKNLSIEFLDRSAPERVLNHFNLRMEPGEIVGLVGESGSGKTMTAQAIAGLLPGHAVIKSGEIRLNGQDLLRCSSRELRTLQGNEIAMIFQEPMTSLNPVMKIGRQVEAVSYTHLRWQIRSVLLEKRIKRLNSMSMKMHWLVTIPKLIYM